MKKQIEWKPVYFGQLEKSEAEPDARIQFVINDFTCKRGITIVPLGRNTYAGDIMKGNRVTGTWRWDMRHKDPHVITYLRVNSLGQHKRYSKGHIVCQKIKEAVMQWRESEHDSFFRASEQEAA